MNNIGWVKFHSHDGSTHIAIDYSVIISQLRRLICVVLIAGMTTGCSKAVEIPRDQFEAAAGEESARYRVEMTDGSQYTVERFSLTDSTVVIEELGPSDERYKRAVLPIVLPLGDLEAIARYEFDKDRSFFALVGAGVVALAIIFLATFELPSN